MHAYMHTIINLLETKLATFTVLSFQLAIYLHNRMLYVHANINSYHHACMWGTWLQLQDTVTSCSLSDAS